MYSTETIIAMAREAAVQAFVNEIEPYVPEPGEAQRWNSRFPIPNMGSYSPAGWRLEEYELIDATGCGYESEPALTVRAFREWITAKQAQYGEPGFAIIETGQFQVVVGVFVRDDSVAGDTFEVEECYNCGGYVETNQEYCPLCEERMDGKAECEECYTYVDPDDLHDGKCRDCLPFRPGERITWTSAGETFEGTVEAYDFDAATLDVLTSPDLRELTIDWSEAEPAYNPADDPNQIQLPIDL